MRWTRQWLFPVLSKTAASAEPCKGSLDYPAAREDLEAVGLIRPFDDFDRPLPRSSDGIAEFVARIAAIGKNMAQPGEALPHSLEDIGRAIAVLNIGGMHENEDEEAAGVGQDVPLAAFDLLARVVAARAAAFGGFDRLVVDHTGTWACLASFNLAQVHDQHRVHRLEQTSVAPGVEIALDRRDWREAFGQKPPGTTARRDVEQGVQDFAHVRCPAPTSPLGPRDERRCQRPLPIRHIARVRTH